MAVPTMWIKTVLSSHLDSYHQEPAAKASILSFRLIPSRPRVALVPAPGGVGFFILGASHYQPRNI